MTLTARQHDRLVEAGVVPTGTLIAVLLVLLFLGAPAWAFGYITAITVSVAIALSAKAVFIEI
jgi:hypothetical protein